MSWGLFVHPLTGLNKDSTPLTRPACTRCNLGLHVIVLPLRHMLRAVCSAVRPGCDGAPPLEQAHAGLERA